MCIRDSYIDVRHIVCGKLYIFYIDFWSENLISKQQWATISSPYEIYKHNLSCTIFGTFSNLLIMVNFNSSLIYTDRQIGNGTKFSFVAKNEVIKVLFIN